MNLQEKNNALHLAIMKIGNAKIKILQAIYLKANDKGIAAINQKYISSVTDFTREHVNREIKELVAEEWIKKTSNGGYEVTPPDVPLTMATVNAFFHDSFAEYVAQEKKLDLVAQRKNKNSNTDDGRKNNGRKKAAPEEKPKHSTVLSSSSVLQNFKKQLTGENQKGLLFHG